MELTDAEVKRYIDSIGPSLGYDLTYHPEFPEGRNDVAAVRRLAENGSTYGFDTIYLVWKDAEGQIHHQEIANSQGSKDYIHLGKVEMKGDKIVVSFGSGGSFSGKPWDLTVTTKVPA